VRGPLGDEAFTPVLRGLKTYVAYVNDNGGVHGRKLDFNTCDDQEDPARNKACAQNLVEDQKVFALVGNSTHTYAAAKYVDEHGVPDVGGEPIGNAYYKYSHLYTILGASGYPRDGTQIGKNNRLYAQTATYRWFKQHRRVTKAAVFFYVIPISKTAGDFIADGLEREGIDVVFKPNGGAGRNPGDPTYDGDVLQMRDNGADGVWNAIDIAGFQKLCQAMDRYEFTVKANVSTVQGWSQKVGESFSSPCRKSVFVNGASRPYSEASNPSVAQFRGAMAKYDPRFPLHQWALEGWAAGMLFTDGVSTMGASPTRKGLLQWLDAQREYTVHGLMQGIDWRRSGVDFSKPAPECFSMAQWSDSSRTFAPATRTFTCDTTAYYSYQPEDDGS
jgi:branched-chain amino acid transport system substrate-binding protein